MKFFVTKHDMPCDACEALIFRGEDALHTFLRTPAYNKMYTYHVTCYIPWYTAMFNNKWASWKNGGGKIYRPKLGRPITVQDSSRAIQINRLRTSLNYHAKLGHQDKVEAIKKEIASQG